jgi:hypothetical protein
MKFTVTLTAEDCIHARRLAMRPRPAMRRIFYVVLVLFAITMAWSVIDGASTRDSNSSVWLFLGLGAYFCAIYFLGMPYRVRRVFKQQKSLQAPVEMELTDTHFLASSANGTFQMPWKDFHKWKKNDRMVLVYQSEAVMHPIPMRALPDAPDRQKLVEILTRTLGPEKS